MDIKEAIKLAEEYEKQLTIVVESYIEEFLPKLRKSLGKNEKKNFDTILEERKNYIIFQHLYNKLKMKKEETSKPEHCIKIGCLKKYDPNSYCETCEEYQNIGVHPAIGYYCIECGRSRQNCICETEVKSA